MPSRPPAALAATRISPMILSDRLIALAKDADRAGLTGTAARLVELACTVFDEARTGSAPDGASGNGASGPHRAGVAV